MSAFTPTAPKAHSGDAHASGYEALRGSLKQGRFTWTQGLATHLRRHLGIDITVAEALNGTPTSAPMVVGIAYALGRSEGARVARLLQSTSISGQLPPARLVSLCAGMVPEGPQRDGYRALLRHYLAGLWQEASRVGLEDRGLLDQTAIRAEAGTLDDEELEAAIEAVLMRFEPVWERKEAGGTPAWRIERAMQLGGRLAILNDVQKERAVRRAQASAKRRELVEATEPRTYPTPYPGRASQVHRFQSLV